MQGGTARHRYVVTDADVTLAAKVPDQVIDARLTGPVNGYTWPVNGIL